MTDSIVQRTVCGTPFAVDTAKGDILMLPAEIRHCCFGARQTIEEFIDYLANKHNAHTPIRLFWEITNRCNLKCPYCYLSTEGESREPSFEEARPMLDWLIDRGLLFATLTGGECTIADSFPYVYEYLKLQGVFVSVYTNGTMLSDSLFKLWKQLPPFMVEVSLHSLDVSSQPFLALKRLQQHNIRVMAKLLLTTKTIASVESIRQWCSANNIPFVIDTSIIDGRHGENKRLFECDTDKRVAFDADKMHLFFNMPEKEPGKKSWFDCKAAQSGLYLSPNLDLSLCPDARHRWPTREDGIGIAYKALMQYVKERKGEPIEACPGCRYSTLCSLCPEKVKLSEIAQNTSQELRIECANTRSYFTELEQHVRARASSEISNG